MNILTDLSFPNIWAIHFFHTVLHKCAEIYGKSVISVYDFRADLIVKVIHIDKCDLTGGKEKLNLKFRRKQKS